MTVTTMPPAATEAEAEEPKGSNKKKTVLVLVALVLLVAGSYKFVLSPDKPSAPEPGEVVRLEPIQVNLAAGHYLKIGIALQLTKDAHEADGSKALDATIELFSGRPMEELTDPEERQKLRRLLEKELEQRYHGDVLGVYFTVFVTQ